MSVCGVSHGAVPFILFLVGGSRCAYRRAALDVKSAYGVAVVHCVERSHLRDTHRRHLQQARNLVHHADARETVLPLSEVEQRHDRRLLVLRRISAEDLLNELFIPGVELEGDVEIVFGRVAVLRSESLAV